MQFDFDTTRERWADMSPIDEQSVSEWAKEGGRAGGSIHMRGVGGRADQMRMWKRVIINPPGARRVRVRAWVKGVGVDNVVAVAARAVGAKSGRAEAFSSTQMDRPMSGTFDWTELETTVDVPTGAANLQVMLMLVGNGEAWFDDVTVEDAGKATLIAPGLFLAQGDFMVASTDAASTEATLLVPLPLVYGDQAPLSFVLRVHPPERLKGVSYVSKGHPENMVAEVQLTGLTTEPDTRVNWDSVVLAAPTTFERVPAHAPMPGEWPEEARPWLAPSRCVQSDDAEIRRIAAEIRGESNDVLEIIKGTVRRAGKIFAAQTEQCTQLDAVQALSRKGSCTSRANLVAALLRGGGVPARVLAGYPSWSGPLQTHYIVEAWVPGYGWYPIESSALQAPWPAHQQINVSIVTIASEDASGPRNAAAGGVPYLSLTEHEPRNAPVRTLGIVGGADSWCDHQCVPLQNFSMEIDDARWRTLRTLAAERWRASLNAEAGAPPTLPRAADVREAGVQDVLRMLQEP